MVSLLSIPVCTDTDEADSPLPPPDHRYYHTRISSADSLKAKKSRENFKRFMGDDTHKGLWCKDSRGELRAGDCVGFITGDPCDAVVDIYRVVGELPDDRCPPYWSGAFRGRGVVELEYVLQRPWAGANGVKDATGLAQGNPCWMPHSLQRVRASSRLPSRF